MKGYFDTNSKVLYVFPQEAGEIPYVDESTLAIAIQPEQFEDFAEDNSTYADLMFPYNYNTMTVKAKVWAGHEDDDIVVPVKPSPELTWSSETATVRIGADDNVFPTLTNSHSVTVTYTSSDTTKATINESTGVITLVDAGNTIISAVFAGDDTYAAQTVTYTLTVLAALVSPDLAWSAETATVTIGADDNVFPTLSNPNNVTVTYSSSDTTKATIDSSTGVITLVDAGETTIMADFAGDDTYFGQLTTYVLTVNAAQVNWSGNIDGGGDYNLTIGNDPATRAAAITAYSADNWYAIGSVDGPHISYNGNDMQYSYSDQTLQGVYNGDDLIDRHITIEDLLDIHIYLHTNTSTSALEVIEDYADGVYTASEVGCQFLFYIPQQ